MKKLTYVLLTCLFLSSTVQAQFFKKLGDKIADKVTNTASENISDKAAKETSKTLNQIWGIDSKKNNSRSTAFGNNADIPDSYSFDWKYTVNVEVKNNTMALTYRLKEGANYMGVEMNSIFMVMDFDNKMTVMYMNGFVKSTKINIPEESSEENLNMEYKEIGSKTILGYECKGYQMENEDYIITFYVTDEAGIGFSSMYKNQKYIPDGFDADWINGNSLLMEMNMDSKKKTSKNMRMICTSIQKEDYTITK